MHFLLGALRVNSVIVPHDTSFFSRIMLVSVADKTVSIISGNRVSSMGLDAKKTDFVRCEQQGRRPVCASAPLLLAFWKDYLLHTKFQDSS